MIIVCIIKYYDLVAVLRNKLWPGLGLFTSQSVTLTMDYMRIKLLNIKMFQIYSEQLVNIV